MPLFLEMLRNETAADPVRMARALKGLRAYQEARREVPPQPMPILGERHGAKLRDYGGNGRPVLFVPSLINPPNVLDLGEDKSLLRWLAARGHRVLLLDWGWNSAARRGLSVADHVEAIIIPLMKELGEPPALVGYCLGGTMAIAAAAVAQVRSLTAMAAPWHFAGFPVDARTTLGRLWQGVLPIAEALGVLPMEVLQSAFWSLDPGRTVAKFETFEQLDPESPEARSFVTLEDWANDGPPVSFAAAQEMFEAFFRDDAPGRGKWVVAGKSVEPASISVPFLNIVSMSDRIVPHRSAAAAGKSLRLRQGHVGMVVGSRAREALWQPLEVWLR